MAFNKTIQMCIFDGNPNGIIMSEISNWNGRAYKIPRNEISVFSQRYDSDNTGIYFLFGKNEDNVDTVYIGESEQILPRLKQHLRDSNYWSTCVTIISKDNVLNKAHIKYLENKFYNLAILSGRYIIINNSIPTCSSVSEYDEAMLEEFIVNAKLLVNTLGFKSFDTIEENIDQHENNTVIFSISSARGANAKGCLVSDGFAVLKDSVMASSTVPSIDQSIVRQREFLLESGVVNENYTFVKDYIFTKPSSAASVVMGRNANGRTEWKTSDKRTIKDIEEENNA